MPELLRSIYDPIIMKIIAEVGLNFNGSMDLAFKTIGAAKACGCDAAKFQNFYVDTFIHQRSEFWEYDNNGIPIKERQDTMFRRHELNLEKITALKAHCDSIGIEFISTPMCRRGLSELVSIGVKTLKNG